MKKLAKKTHSKLNSKKLLHNKFLVVIVPIAILSTLLILFFFFDAFVSKKPVITPIRRTVKLGMVRRSEDPQKITQVTTATTIDAITGKVLHPSSTFSINDKNIYLVVKLNTPTVGSHVDYIRYFNGKFIDHGEITVTNPSTKDVVFNWDKTIRAPSESGTYTITTYYNGIFEKRLDYTIQNRLAFAYPQI